jgi:NADH dehydrogenase
MIVAVTGGTGFIGREMVRQLQAAGHEPIVIGSHDPLDFSRASAVIHLIGIIVEHGKNTFDQAHVEMTAQAIAAAKAAGIRRFLHMSALGTRPDWRSHYHRTKWASEELVRASGLAWTIFRPSLVYGEQDQSVRELARIVRIAPIVPVLGSGKTTIQPIAVEQVASCFINALQNDATTGKVYDLCGPVAFTWNELYDKVLAALGKRKPRVHFPMALMHGVATIAEKVLPKPMITRDQLTMVEEDNTGDPAPAMRDLGLAPESFDAGLARLLRR